MIELILGGARSGKSRIAELRAQTDYTTNPSNNKKIVYVATARVYDDEMAERVKLHKQRRSQQWLLIEEPLGLANVLATHNHPDIIILIECLTLWLSNLLCDTDPSQFLGEKQKFLEQLQQSKAKIIMVSNEVGLGIVPMGELSRRYVDEAGLLHQELAQISDRVTLVVAGLEQDFKTPGS
ncbi:MAG: bifunctional adenosylcobinamide kinase/adenosylcobinamide-phosphate guanylyltransferase [gamma proteobacterium symbiont of Bathyaustriella thionipta]|nr:bifunctional adenosylcobinamide kinase/adenosylcobinamide-phosphate guanylyltransferase [gamma proteobacterium symbiont of Bathyaustriella thionipta]MCU7949022.1 bifunctional adenosylcobinamide kinase/adenosylcobinamide-phosphate guanylyltransferase [gamma proteobacterium symbiont of Bathyaustriella thionipta]MCU7954509.1 bifunctional adenosylcobinamide kinase/adenosylcobinamide-phosphate guanylyltransferase [gamma proteobacterium symbiont of Bathyaustriella thionipta]MCU7955606.1 bifunctiona